MNRPSLRVYVALLIALLVGLGARELAYRHTFQLRWTPNQENAFYWGDRIVHGESHAPGPAAWAPFWRSYVAVYEADEAAVSRTNTLDYVPLRLLMAGLWVNHLNAAYGSVTGWRPEFARSYSAMSMIFELAGAAAMFALVAHWLKRTGPGKLAGIAPARWGRWEQSTVAAILVWLNPAAIIDSHVWPHGEVWILPFYLLAVLAMVEKRYFITGVLLGLGSMFKGQMMMVAPALVLWPLFDRKWRSSLWVLGGIVCGMGLIVWPWVSHGSLAWMRTGFFPHVPYNDVLRKGQSLNLPYFLGRQWHMTLHQHVVDHHLPGVHLVIELRTALMLVYTVLLACTAWGMSRQARRGDIRLLATIAAPWALMYFTLGQMDQRYTVWCACFSAGAVAVGWTALSAHAMLTWAGIATMLEYLLVYRPGVWTPVHRLLSHMIPATLMLTALAVCILFGGAMMATRRIAGRVAVAAV